MKLPGDKLRMSDGSVRQFRSAAARAAFERVAEAIKHGFRPTGKPSVDPKTGRRA